jgi:DNA invertase Pin-like site-specific DNA recombinase
LGEVQINYPQRAGTRPDGIATMRFWLNMGVRIVSVTQEIDLSGITGQMVAVVLFGVAEMELQNNKERQAPGIALAKRRGIFKGRKKGAAKIKPKRANTIVVSTCLSRH